MDRVNAAIKYWMQFDTDTARGISYGLKLALELLNLSTTEFVKLNADVMTRAGFKKCTCGGWKHETGFHLYSGYMYDNKKKLEYVHELKALFFCMTSQNLIINE